MAEMDPDLAMDAAHAIRSLGQEATPEASTPPAPGASVLVPSPKPTATGRLPAGLPAWALALGAALGFVAIGLVVTRKRAFGDFHDDAWLEGHEDGEIFVDDDGPPEGKKSKKRARRARHVARAGSVP